MENDANLNDEELSEDEEEMEPKLRYERILNDMPEILRTDAASCIAVHPKFLALGMHSGAIHILDHQGNVSKELRLHSLTVHQISIDEKGDHFASCSSDGKVVVHGLYSRDNNQQLTFDRAVGAVAIDPNFYRSGTGRRFVTGNDKVSLYEKSFLSRYKVTILHQGEGLTRNITWKGRFAAWATDLTIIVYDMHVLDIISMIRRDHDPLMKSELHRCCLSWQEERTLLLGWADRVKVCHIKERDPKLVQQDPRQRDLPDNYVEIVSMFKTDFYVCGLAALCSGSIVALTVLKSGEDVTEGSRPQFRLIEPHMDDYVEQSSDILSIRGFRAYRCSDYRLESLPEEGLFFVVSPKDVILAKPRDEDDHLAWLLDHRRFEEALTVAMSSRNLKRHTLLGVGQRYLEQLVEEQRYTRAAEVCLAVLGTERQLWEAEVFRFAQLHQLRALAPVLPRGPHRLGPTAYEMVLNEFLQLDPQGFLSLVSEWEPDLYSVPTVVNALRDRLSHEPTSEPLLRALAKLYTHEAKYDLAISIYLEIGASDEVFSLVGRHGLYGVVREKLLTLMQLDQKQATNLLVASTAQLPVDAVVDRLRERPQLLYYYLDALFDKSPALCQQHHLDLAELYAEFAPKKLLPLLRASNSYHLEKALALCRRKKLVPEVVFLLKHMGNSKEALEQIMGQLGDVHEAIAFCKEQDDRGLWQDLIAHSLDKPAFITTLLHKIGTHVDPILLIHRIPEQLVIPQLRDSLVKIMRDYKLQISLRDGCKKILVSDCIGLLHKLHRQQSRGISLTHDQLCPACNRRLLFKDVRYAEDVVVFFCKHAFHGTCLPASGPPACSLCSVKKQVRGFGT
uniref:Vacuolar protein sorting-associated protein 41 homolog n=2 Tax=Ixodes ricinus TaxID=34613 RepID=V5H0C2_IXORI